MVYPCRPETEVGAHARHYNAHSIGICYEGGLDEKGKPAETRTPAQKDSLEDLLYGLSLDYPDAEILGHRDLPWVRKSCPCFDVKEWLKKIFLRILYGIKRVKLAERFSANELHATFDVPGTCGARLYKECAGGYMRVGTSEM